MLVHSADIVVVALLLLLSALLFALIFGQRFRKELLGATGDATLFGLVTVRGTAIVVIAFGLTVGAIYTSLMRPPEVHINQCRPNMCLTEDGRCGVVELTFGCNNNDAGRTANNCRMVVALADPAHKYVSTDWTTESNKGADAMWRCKEIP